MNLCWLSGCVCVCGGGYQRVHSLSSSCINKRWSSLFHTPEPGDSHVPQLLHARYLIVLFVYLAALFHFLCCLRWENTQQYSHDSALPPSLPPSLRPPTPFSSLTPSLLTQSSLICFPSHQSFLWERNCEVIHRATTMPMGGHVFPAHALNLMNTSSNTIWTPKMEYEPVKSKSRAGRETTTYNSYSQFGKVSVCTLLFLAPVWLFYCAATTYLSNDQTDEVLMQKCFAVSL